MKVTLMLTQVLTDKLGIETGRIEKPFTANLDTKEKRENLVANLLQKVWFYQDQLKEFKCKGFQTTKRVHLELIFSSGEKLSLDDKANDPNIETTLSDLRLKLKLKPDADSRIMFSKLFIRLLELHTKTFKKITWEEYLTNLMQIKTVEGIAKNTRKALAQVGAE